MTDEIEIVCDYCGNIFKRRYVDHVTITDKNLLINKDSCNNCIKLKKKEILDKKQELGLLTKNDKGYWNYKENRLKELKECITKCGKIDSIYINKESNFIYTNFSKHNHSIYEAIKELGYDLHDVLTRMPIGYYDDFNNLSNDIQIFIDKYNRFPLLRELQHDLHISSRHINKHGGIYEVKRKMNYNDKNDLVDDRGFINRSINEFVVSQFLIHNNIYYKRERNPFPKKEGKYRSDFTFYLTNNEVIHCEVWGYNGNDQTYKGLSYNDVKKIKLGLYNKYNIKLIQIENELFDNNLDVIQEKLYEIFKDYLDFEYIYVDNADLLPPYAITDEQLLEKLMKYSDDKDKLPTTSTLRKYKKMSLYDEVVKRYNNYVNFAVKFNKLTNKKKSYWNKEIIFDYFKIINNNNLIINKINMDKFSGMNSAQEKIDSLINLKLEFFNLFINEIKLCNEEIKWLNNIINNKGTNIKNKVTKDQQNLAQQILDKYNSINQLNNNLNII